MKQDINTCQCSQFLQTAIKLAHATTAELHERIPWRSAVRWRIYNGQSNKVDLQNADFENSGGIIMVISMNDLMPHIPLTICSRMLHL